MESEQGTCEAAVSADTPVATRQNSAIDGHLDSSLAPSWYRRFRRSENEPVAEPGEPPLRPQPGEALRVLIVDDDRHVAAMLARLLRNLQVQVTTNVAHDGESAFELIEIVKPHVVLLDLMMPGVSGFDLCRQIKSDASSKAIRVIAMTGYNQEANVDLALQAGAECCLAKPFEHNQLLALLGVEIPPAINEIEESGRDGPGSD